MRGYYVNMKNTAAVEFVNISKFFESRYAIKNLNLTLTKEKITTIIGPSGCGKSTTLKMINKLIEPSEGKILINGQDISQMDSVNLRRNIGYVIQQIGLFPHMTIEENVSLVLRLKGEKKDEKMKNKVTE